MSVSAEVLFRVGVVEVMLFCCSAKLFVWVVGDGVVLADVVGIDTVEIDAIGTRSVATGVV